MIDDAGRKDEVVQCIEFVPEQNRREMLGVGVTKCVTFLLNDQSPIPHSPTGLIYMGR
jgi:hypothetical protein